MGEVDDLDDHSHCSSIAQDLAAALDFLVVVTAIRQRVISQVNSGRGFGESLTQSVLHSMEYLSKGEEGCFWITPSRNTDWTHGP